MDRGAWQATVHGVAKESGYNLVSEQQLYDVETCSVASYRVNL